MTDRAPVPVLPPVIPAALLAAGYLADRLAPMPIARSAVATPIGWALLAAAIVLALAAVLALVRARTAVDVRKSTTSLVTAGIYRWSRNPIYLAMVLFGFGLALVANAAAMAFAAIAAAPVLDYVVIRREEAYLEAKFGEAYRRYRASVRRWL